MATYKSAAVNSGLMPDLALAGVILVRTGTLTIGDEIGTTYVTADDALQMVPVPEGAQIIDVQVHIDSAPTSPGAQLDVGDGGDTNRYFADIVIPTQSRRFGYLTQMGAGFNKIYNTNDTIDIVPVCIIDSGHTLSMNVWYKMQGSIADEV